MIFYYDMYLVKHLRHSKLVTIQNGDADKIQRGIMSKCNRCKLFVTIFDYF